MHSFYVFEGSFFQGGGGWEDIHVLTNLPDIRKVVADYLLEPAWLTTLGDDFSLSVYQHGQLAVAEDLYPCLRLKIPGLTTIRFSDFGTVECDIRAENESNYHDWVDEHIFEDQDSNERAEVLYELLSEEFDTLQAMQLGIDWEELPLPELMPPLLPHGASATVPGAYGPRSLTYGYNTSF